MGYGGNEYGFSGSQIPLRRDDIPCPQELGERRGELTGFCLTGCGDHERLGIPFLDPLRDRLPPRQTRSRQFRKSAFRREL